MKITSLFCIALLGALPFTQTAPRVSAQPWRPPAVPLVTHDPYFSIWSPADKLTDADTVLWTVNPIDRPHNVSIYFDASSEIVVNDPRQEVVWSDESTGGLAVLKMGSREQDILAKKGDDLRIDWGYLYVAAPGADAP